MNNYSIIIKKEFVETRFFHHSNEEWICGSFEDAKTVLKEIFDIPSSNGMDDEEKIVLTDGDIDKYSEILRHNGMDDDDVETECARIRKDQRTFAYACRWIKDETGAVREQDYGAMNRFVASNDFDVKIIVVYAKSDAVGGNAKQ